MYGEQNSTTELYNLSMLYLSMLNRKSSNHIGLLRGVSVPEQAHLTHVDSAKRLSALWIIKLGSASETCRG